jgi:hypothetical protein
VKILGVLIDDSQNSYSVDVDSLVRS